MQNNKILAAIALLAAIAMTVSAVYLRMHGHHWWAMALAAVILYLLAFLKFRRALTSP
jgi:hypothetical protein